jgi:uncharacterized RDD family membrane protein YckC
MRCPKCQYISFDNGDRCRNCGYEFSLTSPTPTLDLPIQTGDEPFGPLADLALEATPAAARREGSIVAEAIAPPSPRPITSSFDLPLFKERRAPEDSPRVPPALSERAGTRAEGPRVLSVRRSTPTPRPPNRPPDEPVPGFAFDDAPTPAARSAPRVVAIDAGEQDVHGATASIAPRLVGGFIDVMILSGIGSLVLYLTLRICGVSWSRVAIIPPVPFVSFLLLITGGYFTLFTAAGGQTIGKMAVGIKVVPMDKEQGRVPLGHSVLRAAAYAISALPAGLGFLPALVGADRRAIHDRLADTRVVKA